MRIKLFIFIKIYIICIHTISGQYVPGTPSSPIIEANEITWGDDGSVTVKGYKELIFKSTDIRSFGNLGVRDSKKLSTINITNIDNLEHGILVTDVLNPYKPSPPSYTAPNFKGGVLIEMGLEPDVNNASSYVLYGCYATESDKDKLQANPWTINSFTRNIPLFGDHHSTSIKQTITRYYSRLVLNQNPLLDDQLAFYNISVSVYLKIKIYDATLKKIVIPGFGSFTPAQLFPPDVIVTVKSPDSYIAKKYHFKITDTNSPAIESKLGDELTFIVNSSTKPKINNLPATWLAATGREYYYHCDPSITPGGLKPYIPFDVQSHYVSSNEIDKDDTHYPDWQSNVADGKTSHTLEWKSQRLTDARKNKYYPLYKFKKADILGNKMQRKNKNEGQMMDFLNLWKSGFEAGDDDRYVVDDNSPKYYWNIDSDELLYFKTKEFNTNAQGWTGHVKRMPTYKLTNQKFTNPQTKIEEEELYENSKNAEISLNQDEVENHIGELYEPWQIVREGDYKWSEIDGYPESGFVINDLVDAYWRYQNGDSHEKYRGYEIEDKFMYRKEDNSFYTYTNDSPSVIGKNSSYFDGVENIENQTSFRDNNKHPGVVTITVGENSIDIPIHVNSRLDIDKGMYGNIKVPKYSNVLSKQVIEVNGLKKGVTRTFIPKGRYLLKLRSYSLQDFPYKEFDLSTDGLYDAVAGTWKVEIETDYNQGQCATLYYNGVIVSGAEWKNTNINYVYSKTMKDSQGKILSNYINLGTGSEEFIDNYTQDKRYKYDSSQGYINNYDGKTFWNTYMRHYVVDKNDPKKLVITCMDALDNLWDMKGNAYYWGYRALAKQITDATISQNIVYVLTNDKGEVVQSVEGKRDFEFDVKNTDVGLYVLQIFSKDHNGGFNYAEAVKDALKAGYGNPSPKVEIRVVNYSSEPKLNNQSALGKINTRKLYTQERKLLNMTDPKFDDYRVASVNNILATHMYANKDFRAYKDIEKDTDKNRFAKHNDFNDAFVWTTSATGPSGNGELILPVLPAEVKKDNQTTFADYLNTVYNPTDLWNDDWKDWLRHFSYGKFPKEFVTAAPEQTTDSEIRDHLTAKFALKNKDPYNLTTFLRAAIWLAPTNFDGYRINGLMKTIVDLPDFFNNYAFNGKAVPKKSEYLLPPFVMESQDMSDENKYKEYLFRKLKNGGFIVYNPNEIKDLSVYNTKLNYSSDTPTQNRIYIASTKTTSPITLMIGQDLSSINEYVKTKETTNISKSAFPSPGGVTSYLNLYTLLTNNTKTDFKNGKSECPTAIVDSYGGLGENELGNKHYTYYKNQAGHYEITPYNKGGGTIDTRLLADTYPNSDLNIGLLISTMVTPCQDKLADMTDIKKGRYNAEIDRLIQFCKSRTGQTIYLRVGYEFDLVWNAGYQNTQNYIDAYKHIVTRMQADPDLKNVKYVWQASCSPFNYVDYLAFNRNDLDKNQFLYEPNNLHDPSKLEDWFPGDQYVDIMALSWFENPTATSKIEYYSSIGKTQEDLADIMLDLARKYKKPVMIAESTPRGYDLKAKTKSNTHQFWDGEVWTNYSNEAQRTKVGTTTLSDGSKIWDNFYQPLFNYIENNQDVIKYLHYINADWTAKDQYQWNSEFQYWGNSKVQDDETIKGKWISEITKPKWIHGNTASHGPSVKDFKVTQICETEVKLEWLGNDQPKIKNQKIQLFEKTTLKNSDGSNKLVTSGTLVYDYQNQIVKQDGEDLYILLDEMGDPISQSNNCDPKSEVCNLINGKGKVAITNYIPAVYEDKNELISKLYLATPKSSNQNSLGSFQQLKPNTEYKAVLSFIDYFGKVIGTSASTYFKTEGSCTGGPANRPENKSTQNLLAEVNMFPNPSNGNVSLYFTLHNDSNVNISVVDLGGTILFQETNFRSKGEQEFKLSNLKRNMENRALIIKVSAGTETISKTLLIE